MRVLVLENEQGASRPVVDELTTAGFDVARCHDPEAPAFPCNGLQDHRNCPLDGEAVSVVVLTGQAPPGGDLATGEQGVSCALRQYVPLVVMGEQSASVAAPYAATVAAGPESVVAAVQAAASARLPHHEAVAARTFRQVLDMHGLEGVDATVTATRRDGRLRVQLCPEVEVPEKVAEVAGVRVAGAVRAIDPYAEIIDVGVEAPGLHD